MQPVVQNPDVVSNHGSAQSRVLEEETAVGAELQIRWGIGEGGGGCIGQGRGAFHTPHWVWNGRIAQTQSSLCALCYAGEKREGTDGKSNDWLIESLQNRMSVITNLDEALY